VVVGFDGLEVTTGAFSDALTCGADVTAQRGKIAKTVMASDDIQVATVGTHTPITGIAPALDNLSLHPHRLALHASSPIRVIPRVIYKVIDWNIFA